MKLRKLKILILLVVSAHLISCSFDPLRNEESIEQFLTSSNIAFSIDAEGDYKLTIPLEDQNKYSVWIRKELNYSGNKAVREIFSVGALLTEEQTDYLSSYLLQDNYQTRILGNWAYMKDSTDDRVILIYLIKLPVSTNADYLAYALKEAAFAAGVMKSVVHLKD